MRVKSLPPVLPRPRIFFVSPTCSCSDRQRNSHYPLAVVNNRQVRLISSNGKPTSSYFHTDTEEDDRIGQRFHCRQSVVGRG